MKPQFPLTILFADGEAWVLDNEEMIPGTLEWFDSDDPAEEANVTDARGRSVRLHVVALVVRKCELRVEPCR